MDIKIGIMEKGPLNKISDVQGIKVGHSTINDGDIHTGVTVISPMDDNIFLNKLMAASHVINGFGKSVGLMQLDELGQLESPILLTNTLNVGKVSDALIDLMIERTKSDGTELKSFNPLICECNDSYINNIQKRSVTDLNVKEAFYNLSSDFEEGGVGGGTGMICHQLKGGIGSSSRVFEINNDTYTLGILVQSNHGLLKDLIVNGKAIGQDIVEKQLSKSDDVGSIIIIIATDLPMTSRQLKRVAKRACHGLSRLGCYSGHGSGEVVIAFSTGNVIRNSESSVKNIRMIDEHALNFAFRATVEATEEAVLSSMLNADQCTALDGKVIKSLKDLMMDM